MTEKCTGHGVTRAEFELYKLHIGQRFCDAEKLQKAEKESTERAILLARSEADAKSNNLRDGLEVVTKTVDISGGIASGKTATIILIISVVTMLLIALGIFLKGHG